MNISHLLSTLDECNFRNLECELADAETALLEAVSAIAFVELNDRASEQRDELQLELSRMIARIVQFNRETEGHKDAPEASQNSLQDVITAAWQKEVA